MESDEPKREGQADVKRDEMPVLPDPREVLESYQEREDRRRQQSDDVGGKKVTVFNPARN
jgi:hypothetical protein